MTRIGWMSAGGDDVDVGAPIEQDYVTAGGSLLSDGGAKPWTTISGRGLGPGGLTVTISDNQGETTGGIEPVEAAMSVEDYCGYDSGKQSMVGPIEDQTQPGVATYMIYRNSNTGDHSIVAVYGQDGDPNAGGTLHLDHSGLPSGTSWLVQDDPDGVGPDSYSLSPPTADSDNAWGNNTDGFALGRYQDLSLDWTATVTKLTDYNGTGPPDTIRVQSPGTGNVSRTLRDSTEINITGSL